MNPEVVHLVPALFDAKDGVVGGAERYVHELARHMARVVPTRLVTFGSRPGVRKVEELEIQVLGPARAIRGQASNPMARGMLAALGGARVVHCHQQHVVVSSLAALWCRATGRRVFVSDLGGGGWDVSGYISTDSWYHGHLHLSAYSRSVFGHERRRNAHVIYGGVDVGKFSPATTALNNSQPYVLFVGRWVPHKGIHDLIEALPPGLALNIVGHPYDRDYAASLERQAKGRAVSFITECADADLVTWYRGAACLVLPSVYRLPDGSETRVPELLGQTLIEAMACGTPVIATRVASLPEVVTDGVTGLLAAPNNSADLRRCLERIRDRPDEAAEMGRNGRADVVRRFTWPSVVERCLAIYRG